MLDDTVNLLQQLGFTSYEAKAYIGVLASQPVGAYELAKKSNIPSSKIYETVNKLLKRGVIQFSESIDPVDGADNPSYVALPPEDLSEQLNQQTSQRTAALLTALAKLNKAQSTDFIWPLHSIESLKEKSIGLIESAKESILVSLWPQELQWLDALLEHKVSQGIPTAIVHFGKPTVSIGATYHHPVEKTLHAEKGGRGLTLVIDSREVVMANFNETTEIDACWSRNKAFVMVAEDYVKHDVYITKVTKHLDSEMKRRYGRDYEKLRDIFHSEA